eukprot:TRINITY_DN8219_c0_g1_i17.p1 TRINITY_DN8219_c0_g1~~TRINITY_DN8219_c0_g1_i17.p1  ORF type:complete len:104 (+),score=5.96 TRINITY_DN8219_c0_g1_i17:173-484(+)
MIQPPQVVCFLRQQCKISETCPPVEETIFTEKLAFLCEKLSFLRPFYSICFTFFFLFIFLFFFFFFFFFFLQNETFHAFNSPASSICSLFWKLWKKQLNNFTK